MKHSISNFSLNKQNNRKKSVLSPKEISLKQDSKLPIVITSPFRVKSKAELNRSPRYPKSCYSISYLYQDSQKHSSTSSINQKPPLPKNSLDFQTLHPAPSISSTSSHHTYQTPNTDIFSAPIKKSKQNFNFDSPNPSKIEDTSETNSKWLRYNEELEFNDKNSSNFVLNENLKKIKPKISNKVSKIYIKSFENKKKPDKYYKSLRKFEKNKRNKRVSLLYANDIDGNNEIVDCKSFPALINLRNENDLGLFTGIKSDEGIDEGDDYDYDWRDEIVSSEGSTERIDSSLGKDCGMRDLGFRDSQEPGNGFGKIREKNRKRPWRHLRMDLKEVKIMDCEKGFESTDLDQIKSSDSLKNQESEESITQNPIPPKPSLKASKPLKTTKNLLSTTKSPNPTKRPLHLSPRSMPKPISTLQNLSQSKLSPNPKSPIQPLNQISPNENLSNQVPIISLLNKLSSSTHTSAKEKLQNPDLPGSDLQFNPNQLTEFNSNPTKPENVLSSEITKNPLNSSQSPQFSSFSRQSTKKIQFFSPNEKSKLIQQLQIKQADKSKLKLKRNETMKTLKSSKSIRSIKDFDKSESFDQDLQEDSDNLQHLDIETNADPVGRFVKNYSSSMLATLQVMIMDLQESLKVMSVDSRTVDLEKVSGFFDGFCQVDVKRRNGVIAKSLKQALRGINKDLYKSLGRVKLSGLGLMIKGIRDSILCHRVKTDMIRYLQDSQEPDPEKIAEQLKVILDQSLISQPSPLEDLGKEPSPHPATSFKSSNLEDQASLFLSSPSHTQNFSSDIQSPRPSSRLNRSFQSYFLNLIEDDNFLSELNELDLGKSLNQFYFSSKIDPKLIPDPNLTNIKNFDIEISDDLDINNLSSLLLKKRFLSLNQPEEIFDESKFKLIIQNLKDLDPSQNLHFELKRIQKYLKKLHKSKTMYTSIKK